MKIAFDAKRAFNNKSGLGNYSRSTIEILSRFYPENDYFLYTPSINQNIDFQTDKHVKIVQPTLFHHRKFKAFWRSVALTKQLQRDGVSLYHGLSHELPMGIQKSKIKSVVSMHDLIFVRYPELYKPIDRKLYHYKYKHSAQIADQIIAISEQTKNDLIEFFNIDKNKIEVVYQGCNPQYYRKASAETKKQVRDKHQLPAQFILSVGTIEERKNLLTLVKALHTGGIEMPLVVVGKSTPYAHLVRQYIARNGLEKQFIFLEYLEFHELAPLYQMADLFVYPSVFEGFGIPILEALNSETPVISSTGSCFRETGGEAALYVNPHSPEALSDAIKRVLSNASLQRKMIAEGLKHAQLFREEKIAKNLMQAYKQALK